MRHTRILTIMVLAVLLLASCAEGPVAGPRTASTGFAYTLAPSAARTTAFTGTSIAVGSARTIIILLDITAVSGTTPTLDVKVQTSIDGTTWCDIAAFAQRNAAAKQVMRISAIPGTVQAEAACTDGTLAAGTIHQGPLAGSIRVKHALPGGTTPSFTYSVTAWVNN